MDDKKAKEGNKSNVIVLTIIAIVTVVIVTVGATFAYLANSMDSEGTSKIDVKTNGGNDLLLMNPGEDIVLEATVENFGEDDSDLVNTSVTSQVFYQTTQDTLQTVTYKVSVEVTGGDNEFEYTSGDCYNYVESAVQTIQSETYNYCINSVHGLWGTMNGTNYNCFDSTIGSPIGGNSKYTTELGNQNGGPLSNELLCNSNNKVWIEDREKPEITIDLYKGDKNIAEEDCESGVCINVSTGEATGENAVSCNNNPETRWVEDIYEGICYKLAMKDETYAAHADITMLGYDTDGSIVLLGNEQIQAINNASATNQYKPVITLINYNHLQIINGKKSFLARLKFERTDIEP